MPVIGAHTHFFPQEWIDLLEREGPDHDVTMDSFPKLDVVLPHAGGMFPPLIGRWDHGTEVREEMKHMKQLPSAYLRRFYYDTIAHNDELMMNVVRQVGVDRIVMGSDYCFQIGDEHPVATVNRLSKSISVAEREMILGKTAERLLKLRLKRISTASHFKNCSGFKALFKLMQSDLGVNANGGHATRWFRVKLTTKPSQMDYA